MRYSLGQPIQEPSWLLKIFAIFDSHYRYFAKTFDNEFKYNTMCYIWIRRMRRYHDYQILSAIDDVLYNFPSNFPNAEEYAGVIDVREKQKKLQNSFVIAGSEDKYEVSDIAKENIKKLKELLSKSSSLEAHE